MKFCFISPKSYPLFNPEINATFGGAEVQMFLIASEIAKSSEHDVHAVTADYGQEYCEKRGEITLWKGVNFNTNPLNQAFLLFKTLSRTDCDIYIQRTLTVVSGMIAVWCRLRNKKFIYMVAHDSETDGTHLVFRNPVSSFIAGLAFRLAHILVVQSSTQMKNMEEKDLKPVLLRSGYPIPDNTVEKEDFILWVGRSEDWKRPELFIRLAEDNPDFRFVMICPSATNSPELSMVIEEKARAVPNLEFIPFVPFSEIEGYFNRAKLFVNTSTQEGFPNTFIQAALAGTPILSMNVNPDGFLDEYRCGVCCEDDYNCVNNSVKTLLSDNTIYDDYSRNAFIYAKNNYGIEDLSTLFLSMTNKLLK